MSRLAAMCFEAVGIEIEWDGCGFTAPADLANDPDVKAIAPSGRAEDVLTQRLASFAIARILPVARKICRPMKTILAVLTFALVAGQALPDQVKSFIGHITGGSSKAAELIVTATPRFGSNPQPGDQVSWVIDVRNPGAAPVYYWALVQVTTNLSAPQMSCPPAAGCQNINGPAFNGNVASASITQMAPGASEQITETATIQASGPFGVVVRSGAQPVDPQDPATVGVVVANLPGETGQPPAPTNTPAPTGPQTGPYPHQPGGSTNYSPGSGWGSRHDGRDWLPWLAVGGLVGAAAAGATALGVRNARRKWWTNHVSAHADAGAGQAGFTPRPIPNHVIVRIAYGPAGARGPVPIERIGNG